MTVHLLNYDVSAKGEPSPVRDLPFSVALPDAIRSSVIERLTELSPDADDESPLRGEVRDGRLKFGLAELRLYRVVEAVLRVRQ